MIHQKLVYQCWFKTQGRDEDAENFASRIENFVNEVRSRDVVAADLPVQITSDGNGRKEAFFQWYKVIDQ